MYREDGLMAQLAGTFGAAAGGYLLESWQKAQPGNALPVATEMATLVGGALGRRVGRHPIWTETMEALQYGSAWGLGRWTADVTTTLGGNSPGVAHTWHPGGTGTSGWLDEPPAPTDVVTPLPATEPHTTQAHFQRRRIAI